MEDKRQYIIERTFELFHRYGIKSVSMDDIARESGMSKKTLYQHVKDKSELVELVVKYIRGFMEELISVFFDDSLNAVQQHFEYWQKIDAKFVNCKPTLVFDLRKYYPAFFHDMNEWKRKTAYDYNHRNIEQGKKEGLYRADVDSRIIAKIMVSYNVYTFDPTNELFTEAELSDIKMFQEVFKYHFNGICTLKGMETVKNIFCDIKK